MTPKVVCSIVIRLYVAVIILSTVSNISFLFNGLVPDFGLTVRTVGGLVGLNLLTAIILWMIAPLFAVWLPDEKCELSLKSQTFMKAGVIALGSFLAIRGISDLATIPSALATVSFRFVDYFDSIFNLIVGAAMVFFNEPLAHFATPKEEGAGT